MKIYVVNEIVSDEELAIIGAACHGHLVQRWPSQDAVLPHDIELAILIIRSHDTALEHQRAASLVSAPLRIICVFLNHVDPISSLAKMYCSANVDLQSGALGQAIDGSDDVQKTSSGNEAPMLDRGRHNC